MRFRVEGVSCPTLAGDDKGEQLITDYAVRSLVYYDVTKRESQ